MADLRRGETFAMGMVRPKTTALFFDKLWVHPYLIKGKYIKGKFPFIEWDEKILKLIEDGVPSELCVSAPLGAEIYLTAFTDNIRSATTDIALSNVAKSDQIDEKLSNVIAGEYYIDESGLMHIEVLDGFCELIRNTLDDHVSTNEELLNRFISDFHSASTERYRTDHDSQPSGNVYLNFKPIWEKDASQDTEIPWRSGLPTKYRNKAIYNLVKLYAQKGINLTPIYLNSTEYDEVSRPESPGLEICLDMIPVIIDSELTWKQVLEFRRDKKAREKLVRLRRWFSIDLLEKDEEEIRSNLEKRLDDYGWALKKHGIKTLVAGTTSLLSFVAAPTAMQMLTSSPLAAAAGGIAIAGGAVAWISNKVIERAEIQREEVAYIYEVRQLADVAG